MRYANLANSTNPPRQVRNYPAYFNIGHYATTGDLHENDQANELEQAAANMRLSKKPYLVWVLS